MLSPLTSETPSQDPASLVSQVTPPDLDSKHRRRRYNFLAAWVRSPKDMGAILPSSRRLARAMVAQVDKSVPGVIIELGAGTGVMTNALLQAGLPKDRLLIIERDPHLHAILSSHFQGLNILCEDAMNLEKVLARHNITEVCAIVSSLPFITIPKPIGHVIQAQMAKVIGKQGCIVQFTYGVQSPIGQKQQKKLQLTSKRSKIVVANVPPAHIWIYRQA